MGLVTPLKRLGRGFALFAAGDVIPATCGGTGTTTAAGEIARLGLSGLSFGQCRLVYTSASALTLKPYNGNQILVGGAFSTIPSAGLTLAATGLAASTLYYVYAKMVSGSLALIASTTGHATDPTYGIEVKSDDASATFVGPAYVETAATFTLSAAKQYVRSWFNRVPLLGQASPGSTSPSTASTSNVQLWASAAFVALADEVVTITAEGSAYPNGTGTMTNSVVVDGAVQAQAVSSAASGISSSFSPGVELALSEGLHSAYAAGKSDGPTFTWISATCLLRVRS